MLRNGMKSAAPTPTSSSSQRGAGDDLRGGKDKQWIQVGVSDLTGEPAEIIRPSGSSRCTCPPPFVTAMRSVITPGHDGAGHQASVSSTSTGLQTTVSTRTTGKN